MPGTPALAQQKATLNLVTAGDQNMVDYVRDYLAPMFEKEHPGVTVRAVGTGPGDAGSQKIYEKLEAEKRQQQLGYRCGRHSPEGSWRDGDKRAAGSLCAGYTDRKAGQFRSCKASAGRECRRLRDPDVQQPDRDRLQHDDGEGSARNLRRARKMGCSKPEKIWLQRRQGR